MSESSQSWRDAYTREEFIALVRDFAENQLLSATEIARRVGHNATRNTIIGVANRARPKIKLPGASPFTQARVVEARARKNPEPARSMPSPKKPPRVTTAPKKTESEEDGPFKPDYVPPPPSRVVSENPKSLAALPLSGQCKFPLWPHGIGEPGPVPTDQIMCCANPTPDGSSWCEGHRAVVFSPRTEPRGR